MPKGYLEFLRVPSIVELNSTQSCLYDKKKFHKGFHEKVKDCLMYDWPIVCRVSEERK